MEALANIKAAVIATDGYHWSDRFDVPELASLKTGVPAVIARPVMMTNLDGFNRMVYHAIMIWSVVEKDLKYDGLDTSIEELVSVFEMTDGCYPRLLPHLIRHDYKVAGDSKRDYLAVVIQIAGDPLG